MTYKIENDWTTKAGLRAVCLVCLRADGTRSHRCGYVEVPRGHPLHGVNYYEPAKAIPREALKHADIGKKRPLLVFTAAVDAFEGEPIRRSPDIVFDVHGGLTFSRIGKDGYPIKSDGWWFRFDCAHAGDGYIDALPGFPNDPDQTVRSQEYVEAECERLHNRLWICSKGKRMNGVHECLNCHEWFIPGDSPDLCDACLKQHIQRCTELARQMDRDRDRIPPKMPRIPRA